VAATGDSGPPDVDTMDASDPREAVARLEQRIEELADKVESCRKFVLASRVAVAFGGVWLVAAALGAIRMDGLGLTAAMAAVLGGTVVWGSNRSTAKEANAQMAAAEAARSELIAGIEMRVVSGRGDPGEAHAEAHRRLH
jgi:hypothetical protein